MRYRPEIDGLRAIAVIPVIFFHAGFTLFKGGFVGVDIFFVISGYLITTILLNDMDDENFSLVYFYERRARRILPALFIMIMACLPFAWMWMLPGDMEDFAQSIVAVSTFSSNILFWQESGYFASAAELKPLLHTWSLADEEQYYILFPLFLMLCWRFGKRWILAILVMTFILSLGLAHWAAYNNPPAAFYLLPTRVWEMIVGAFVAFTLQKKALTTPQWVNQAGSTIGLILIIYATFGYDRNTPFPSLYTLAPTVGAALIILFAVKGTVVNRLIGTKALVGIGFISYSAYLWHQPLLAFTKYRSLTAPSETLLLSVCLATFPLAYLSWRYVERPFRSKTFIRRTQVFAYSAVSGLFLISVGTYGISDDGFKGRFAEEEYAILKQFTGGKDYVPVRFNTFKHRSFDKDDATPNILIIGDSYAQDLVNALFEANIAPRLSISTHHIPARCGNLLIQQDLSQYIEPVDRVLCAERYNNNQLHALIKEADEIWLASNWQEWVVDYLPESIENLHKLTDARLRIFGNKYFGPRAAKDFLDGGTIEALLAEKALEKDHISIMNKMRVQFPSIAEYIDVSMLLCGSDDVCGNRTPSGAPISHDGRHLTPAGARYYGNKLKHILDDTL